MGTRNLRISRASVKAIIGGAMARRREVDDRAVRARAEYIREIVAAAPPLSPDDIAWLRALVEASRAVAR